MEEIRMELRIDPQSLQSLVAAIEARLAPRLAAIESALDRVLQATARERAVEPPSPSAPAVINRREVANLTGLGDTTIWRKERSGDFPPRFQISPRRVGWHRAEVLAWVEAQRAAA